MRAKPVHVTDLLEQIADGIGKGNRALIEQARTVHGTLAVKTADVSVEFVLSSVATTAGLTGPGVGALTLVGIATTQTTDSSRATIKLQIVPIAIAAPAANDAPAPGGGGAPPAIDDEAQRIAEFRASLLRTLGTLRERVDSLTGLWSGKRTLLAELDAVEELLRSGDLQAANQAISTFVARHPTLRR